MTAPSPADLWHQAGGDPQEYRRLLREAGLLLVPGDPGYEEASVPLPCGWDPGAKDSSEDRGAE